MNATENISTNRYKEIFLSSNKKDLIFKMFITFLFALAGIIMLLPFLWMVSASFKLPADVMKYPIKWIPDYWYPNNITAIWSGRYNFALIYFNSIKVTLISVLGVVITSSMAGYGFARLQFVGKDRLFIIILATMIIPAQVTMVPRFILFDALHLINSHWSLILPNFFTAFGVFMMRQFFIQIPFEISEAAHIDGAGEIRIWYQIIMPLCKTAVTTLVILTFCWFWNDYENPLIFLRSKKLLTIPVGLNAFIEEERQENLIMAAATFSLIPIFFVFIIGQKYFVEGLASGAVKG